MFIYRKGPSNILVYRQFSLDSLLADDHTEHTDTDLINGDLRFENLNEVSKTYVCTLKFRTGISCSWFVS